MKKFTAFFLLLTIGVNANGDPKILTFHINKPIWAIGLNNAKWLISAKKPNAKTIAFFNFSVISKDFPDKPVTGKEGDTGRTTRSLPLYLAERIIVESDCKAENYIFVAKGYGPVVFGKEQRPEHLLALFRKNKPDYLVTGYITKDYLKLRSQITLKIWDTRKNKVIFETNKSGILSKTVDVAKNIPYQFINSLKQKKICSFKKSDIYPRPRNNVLSHYLDGLGQLLAQTLTEYKYMTVKAIWGEADILNWYLALWKKMPGSNAPRLMYIRGILSSYKYGGIAEKTFIPNLIRYIQRNQATDNIVIKVSPLIFARIKEFKLCNSYKAKLLRKSSGTYKKWLSDINCKSGK